MTGLILHAANCEAALYAGYVWNRTDGTGAVIDTAGGISATGNSWAFTGNAKTNMEGGLNGVSIRSAILGTGNFAPSEAQLAD